MLLLLAALGGRLIPQNRPLWVEWLRIAAFVIVALALAMLLGTQVRAALATEAQTLEISASQPPAMLPAWSRRVALLLPIAVTPQLKAVEM